MRVLLRIFFLTGLVAIMSCSSHVRQHNDAQDEVPASEQSKYQGSYDYSGDADGDSTDILEFADPSTPESQLTDEDIIYKFTMAEEYYAFGVAANLDKKWDEAQYNFEKAIELLTSMDISFDSSDSENLILEQTYRRLMSEITADYKLTLFNLNVLSQDASPFALDEKFSYLDSISAFARDTVETRSVIAEKITYDVPVDLNDRVKKWLIYFQTSARKFAEGTLARSRMYLPLMEKIFAEEGLPHDLVYLPFIESGYKDRAYSYAHAAGFWQFISATGKTWGLTINWWYDERYDFEKSTRAAARYLKHLYEEHGDWRLALTAYNGGSGNVNKMKRHPKNKDKDYWDWTIRNGQMRNFVPKFMAAVIICKEPERYGFDVQYTESLEWDEVAVDRAVYLSDVAEATGVSERKIQELNPAVRRGYTPPDVKNFKLRVPRGKSSKFYADFGNMRSVEETSWVKHTIRGGETISTIARKYGVSQSAIIQANNLKRPYRIFKGKTLMVPVPVGRSERYADSSYELTGRVYLVRPGDNLSQIAKAFGTTPEAIQRVNNLPSKHVIAVGQSLKIPGMGGSSSGASADRGDYIVYTVRKGDTLSKIAGKYGLSVASICNVNNISARTTLLIGQKLKIPGNGPNGISADSERQSYTGEYFNYTVRRGQNLNYLAKKFGTTVDNICALNGISPRSTLMVGQELKIPGKEPSTAYTVHALGHESKDEYVVHTVSAGQNLTYISDQYGASIVDICALNNISMKDPLLVGQQLKVPFANETYAYYIIKRGDTLWDIANTFGTSTSEIINLNDHINPHSLRVGDKLKIKAR